MQFYENYYWSSIEVVVAYSVTTVCVNFPVVVSLIRPVN